MKTLTIGLSVVAAAQLLLAGALWWQDRQQPEASALLALHPKQLTEIKLEHQGKTLQLVYQDGAWRLPALQHEPARPAKVTALLTELEKARLQWPVAETTASQARFEVAEDKYQWKLTLAAGDHQQLIYLGSSPAFKQLYLRRDKETEIYQQQISTMDWSTEPEQWFDRNLLQISQVIRIKLPQLELEKEAGQWQVRAAQGETQVADKALAGQLQQLFSALQVSGSPVKPLALKQPEQQLQVEVQSLSAKHSYQLQKQQDNYLIKRDDRAVWYPLAAEQAKQLFELEPEKLLAKQSGQSNSNEKPSASEVQAEGRSELN